MKKIVSFLGKIIFTAGCFLISVSLIAAGAIISAGLTSGFHSSGSASSDSANMGISAKFDMYVTNAVSDALDGILATKKVYWLSDEDPVAPEPNPSCYGSATAASDLAGILQNASQLLDGQELVFSLDTPVMPDSSIKYYLDDTILAITWKQKIGTTIFTFSEVKIAHPSQFRRFLAGGEYGTHILYTTTEMAKSVRAVTASSADYYAYRPFGNLVYNGSVKRSGDTLLDTCYIDDKGDLLFVHRADMFRQEDMERFVAEHNIRFSLAFGPVLVDNGEPIKTNDYNIGETSDRYSRAALCQQGTLHYIVVTANRGGLNIRTFAKHLSEMGIRCAYALDGGQTASIVTGDTLMNDVDYGGERKISDIIYFATAIPSGISEEIP